MPPSLKEAIRKSIKDFGIRFLTGVFPKDPDWAFGRMCVEAGAVGEQIIHQPWRTSDGTIRAWPHYIEVFGKTKESSIINQGFRV